MIGVDGWWRYVQSPSVWFQGVSCNARSFDEAIAVADQVAAALGNRMQLIPNPEAPRIGGKPYYLLRYAENSKARRNLRNQMEREKRKK